MLRLNWITDIHNCHEDGQINALPIKNAPKRRQKIHKILDTFVEQARIAKPTLVVNTGDNIDTTLKHDYDLALQAEVHERLSVLNGSVVSVLGNHDVSRMRPAEIFTRFGVPVISQLIEEDDASIIIWNASATPHTGIRPKHYIATPDNLADLETLLSRTSGDKPVLLFSHIPILSDAQTNPIDSGERNNPDKSRYDNASSIVGIIKHSGRNVFAFAGHRHINRVLEDGNLTCITMDRLYRDKTTKFRPKGENVATIEVKRNRLRLHREGAMPDGLKFKF